MWGDFVPCSVLSTLVNGRAHPRSTHDGDFQQHDPGSNTGDTLIGTQSDQLILGGTAATALVLSTPTVALSALMGTTPFLLIRQCWASEPARRLLVTPDAETALISAPQPDERSAVR